MYLTELLLLCEMPTKRSVAHTMNERCKVHSELILVTERYYIKIVYQYNNMVSGSWISNINANGMGLQCFQLWNELLYSLFCSTAVK
jgi:hypothetical protein